YKEWKGSFYPEKLPAKKMLGYYAERFSSVEINATFRQMPRTSVLESWASQVPPAFRFVLKAPQRITHFKRLKDVEADTEYLLSTASCLQSQLGAILYQFPSNFKKDLARLEPFLELLGGRVRSAFEFRHESWLDDEVFALLEKHACALCVADTEGDPPP